MAGWNHPTKTRSHDGKMGLGQFLVFLVFTLIVAAVAVELCREAGILVP